MIMYTAMDSEGWDEDIEQRKEKEERIEVFEIAFKYLYEASTLDAIKEAYKKSGIDIESFYHKIHAKEKAKELYKNLSDYQKSILKQMLNK